VSHEVLDKISLELGRRTAARLRQDPGLLRLAHENLARWSQLNANSPSLLRCYSEWHEVLSKPLEKICQVLDCDTDQSRRLRSNSPFAGVLSAREVWEIKRRFHHAADAA
jgi:hypothetical protein